LYQYQRRLRVLDSANNPRAHMQRVEHIKDGPATSPTALGMSDDDILAVKSGRKGSPSRSNLHRDGVDLGGRQCSARGLPLHAAYPCATY